MSDLRGCSSSHRERAETREDDDGDKLLPPPEGACRKYNEPLGEEALSRAPVDPLESAESTARSGVGEREDPLFYDLDRLLSLPAYTPEPKHLYVPFTPKIPNLGETSSPEARSPYVPSSPEVEDPLDAPSKEAKSACATWAADASTGPLAPPTPVPKTKRAPEPAPQGFRGAPKPPLG